MSNNICHSATELAVVPELKGGGGGWGVLQHPEHPPGYATAEFMEKEKD